MSQPALVLTPSFEFAVVPVWLFTVESQLQLLKWVPPTMATLNQDPAFLTSLTAGVHLRSRVFELGFIGGVGQNSFLTVAPTYSLVTIQNLTMPFIGGRFSYNGRWSKNFFFRLGGSYERDLPVPQDRTALTITQNARIRIQTEWGIGKVAASFRFTAAGVVQNSQTSLGNQTSITLLFGVSIGNLWGQRIPLVQ